MIFRNRDTELPGVMKYNLVIALFFVSRKGAKTQKRKVRIYIEGRTTLMSFSTKFPSLQIAS